MWMSCVDVSINGISVISACSRGLVVFVLTLQSDSCHRVC